MYIWVVEINLLFALYAKVSKIYVFGASCVGELCVPTSVPVECIYNLRGTVILVCLVSSFCLVHMSFSRQ
jgi:hypothetical protein